MSATHAADALEIATAGGCVGAQRTLTMAGAINAGLAAALEADPAVLLMGEDIGALGGVFRVTDGLAARFGTERVRDTPLAEAGIVGTAVGLALAGYRPVVEIQFDGFVFPAFNQLTTQVAKLRYRSGGTLAVPLVVRIPYGGGIGAIEHHSESPEVYFAHTPGLRVVTPATPGDAYLMIQQAIASPDPVIFLEPKARYWTKGPVTSGLAGPLPGATVVRPGTDVTLAGYGPTVAVLLAAAEAAAADGIHAEVIDMRSISPLDVPTVATSVRRTGRLVIAHEAPTFLGPGAELAARIQSDCFYELQAPIERVGARHTPYPASRHEHDYLPNPDRVIAAIARTLEAA